MSQIKPKIIPQSPGKNRMVELNISADDLLFEYFSEPTVLFNDYHRALAQASAYSDSTDFAVGSMDDLSKPVTDFSLFERALAKLNASDVMKQINETSGQVRARKRARSQYDGEYDFDKQWDIEPFMRRETKQTTGRIINFDVYAGFSSSVDGRAINEYCVFVAAIVKLIEASGVMVNLRMIYETRDMVETATKTDCRAIVNIKASDQYLNPGDLLKAMSSNFYRRAYFMYVIFVAHATKSKARIGLGYPFKYTQRSKIDHETGTFSLYSMPSPSEQGQLMVDLLNLMSPERTKNETA